MKRYFAPVIVVLVGLGALALVLGTNHHTVPSSVPTPRATIVPGTPVPIKTAVMDISATQQVRSTEIYSVQATESAKRISNQATSQAQTMNMYRAMADNCERPVEYVDASQVGTKPILVNAPTVWDDGKKVVSIPQGVSVVLYKGQLYMFEDQCTAQVSQKTKNGSLDDLVKQGVIEILR